MSIQKINSTQIISHNISLGKLRDIYEVCSYKIRKQHICLILCYTNTKMMLQKKQFFEIHCQLLQKSKIKNLGTMSIAIAMNFIQRMK